MKNLYHVSPSYNRGSIKKKGLSIHMDETGLRSIFLWEKVPPTSSSFDIWVVDVSGLLIEEDASEGAPLDSWMYTSNIPQFRVHLIAIPGNNVAGKPGILVI